LRYNILCVTVTPDVAHDATRKIQKILAHHLDLDPKSRDHVNQIIPKFNKPRFRSSELTVYLKCENGLHGYACRLHEGLSEKTEAGRARAQIAVGAL
jgi:hypothetical protein